MKDVRMKVSLVILVPLITFSGTAIWWSADAADEIDKNRVRIEGKADQAEVDRIRGHQVTQNGALNWIGAALERIADKEQITLPPRKVIPSVGERE